MFTLEMLKNVIHYHLALLQFFLCLLHIAPVNSANGKRGTANQLARVFESLLTLIGFRVEFLVNLLTDFFLNSSN